MADKKLTDLPLETASAETDEIYAVRNGVSDVRLRLKDVIPDNVSAPKIVSPANGATNVSFKPQLVASGYAPLYDNIDRDYRQFQLTLSGDVDFLSPLIDVSLNSNTLLLNEELDITTEYIWRCRDASIDGDMSAWSDVGSFETRAGEVNKPTIISPENGSTNVSDRVVVSSSFSITGGSDSQAGSVWELYNADDQLIYASGFVTNKSSYTFDAIQVETTYKVRVKHVGVSYGESEWSDFVEFTTGGFISEPYSYLAIAHYTSPFVTIYKRSGDTFTKLTNPLQLPTGNGTGANFSPDGNYLSITHATSPFVTIYKRSGDTFTKLTNPSQLPTGTGRGASFSPDGNYLSIAHSTTPYVTIYKRNGDTFTKLANPSQLPTNTGFGASFSPDGNYLSIAHGTSPFVTIYKRNGDTFTKLANPSQLPTGFGQDASFSPDGNYLSIVHETSPFVTIYKRSGDTFTKLANPSQLPTGHGYGASFSPDGNYLSIAHASSPYVTIYKRSGDTFTKLANPSQLPTNTGFGASFSSDGNYLSIAHDVSPFVTIYKRSGDTFDKVNDPLELPTNAGFGISSSLTMYTSPPPPPPTPGSIGTPGYHGFGVGTCTNEDWLTELGLSEMEGTNDHMHDNYGNYIHENSSQMVFIPKFYYRIGNPNHPNYDVFGNNSLEIVGIETYETEAEANADGFILHRAFIDGGQEKIGFFVDKYHLSKKSDDPNVAVSVRYGVPISLTNDTNYTNSDGMPNCTGIYEDSLELCKARGSQYNQCSAFALSALAMLSLAHGQYAETSDACAWFDPIYTTNFPKGCNNDALGDVNDSTLTFISAGDSGNTNKPQCGSANNLAKTTHNGQNSGVADLNGTMFDLGLGITNFGTSATSTTVVNNSTLYVLKESVALASLTSGWNTPTDAWQSSDNIGTLYDQFTSQISLGTSGTVYWGNGNNQVFPTDLTGNNRAICGVLGVNDSSFSASGTNMFGNDYFRKYNVHNMVVLFGGRWNNAASAGVFYRNLSSSRSNAINSASSRGIAYGT